MSDNIIEVINLVKEYEGGLIKALNGVSFNVRQGEFIAIMGPSGSGKSSLLNLIGVLDTPTSGDILFKGQSLNDLKDKAGFRALSIGFIFQAFYLMPTLTAMENVQLPMFELKLTPVERRQRAAQLLEQVGMEHRMHQVPSKLSGGERQRVAIARSLANDPEIILADEPTGNVDRENAYKLMELLKDLNEQHRRTLIIVTHDSFTAGYAKRTLQMLDGRIVSESN